jgi:hypothetical protein
VLSTPIESNSIKSNDVVQAFTSAIEQNSPSQAQFRDGQREYQLALLDELFDFTVLWRRLLACIKIANEHKSILTSPPPSFFGRIVEPVKAQLTEVADKFAIQRRNIVKDVVDLEASPHLQERVAKAAAYFADKIESLVDEPLRGLAVETDNRDARKMLTKAINAAREETAAKLYCFNACRAGIVFADYLKARARSLFQEGPAKAGRMQAESHPSEAIDHPELYRMLKQWRADQAEKMGRPAFWVLHNTTLAAIAAKLPATGKELGDIKGLKGKKGKIFGDEILKIVARYRSENNLPPPASEPDGSEDKPVDKRKKKPKTKDKSPGA